VESQDAKFFNTFSYVISILFVVVILLFAVAWQVGKNTQSTYKFSDQEYIKQVESNLAIASVAVSGQDNSSLAIVAAEGAVIVALEIPSDGIGVYEQVCAACHLNGLAGAPRSDDKAAWAVRIAQGKETLYKHAIEGYQGQQGVMPARGGRSDLSDDLVKAAVDYMVDKSK